MAENDFPLMPHVALSDPVTVVVGPAIPLRITSFAVSPTTIRVGQSATLTWSVEGSAGVLIDKLGTEPSAGSATITPTTTTTYTLTAMQGASTLTQNVTVEVVTTPAINVTSFPAPMLEQAGSGGVTTSYTLTNSGGAPANVTLGQTGDFFTQTPASFTLQPGATQAVTITAAAQPPASYEGTSTPAGAGVPSGLQIPVKLLSAAPPSGTVSADPASNRVDVAAGGATNPTGAVTFTNRGTATLIGILTSDVPWIIPQTGSVTIAPGATGTFSFTIDRTKRPDASAPLGSVEGSLALSFLNGSGSSFAKRPLDTSNNGNISVTTVKVVDTAQPSVTTAGIPALATGEVALFVPGVGHVTGSNNFQFASDVNILNAFIGTSVDDLKLYYTTKTDSTAAAKSASIGSLANQTSVSLADVAKTVFSTTNDVGTLQVRSANADKLAVAAKVLTTNNPAGTFGNTIPVFRSDRATAQNGTIVINGLRKDGSSHTNLYIQETSGNNASVQVAFLDNRGSTLSSSTQAIDAFKMLQLPNAAPQNAAAVVITNASTNGAKIAAYATPVDETSSDTWSIADWSQQLGYDASQPTVIQIAGNVHGANNTFYRTDVFVTNRGTSQASATLQYISRAGDKIDKQLTLGGQQTTSLTDVVGTLFGVSGDSTGFIIVTPVTGSFEISSRTYTTAGTSGTFGTGVPTVAAASAIRAGGWKPIAGLNDAARTTVIAARPGTYRTNFALMETSGQPVTVRVTFRFTFPAGEKAKGIGGASRDYALNANGFLMLNSIAGEILGAARLQYGDLTDVEADFQVLSGKGAVMMFTSSVDNATGDSILRTE